MGAGARGNASHEHSNAYLKRAEDNLKFYVESSDEDKEGWWNAKIVSKWFDRSQT